MKTMRRVVLVVVACVAAGFIVLASLMIWLGPLIGIAVGLDIAFSLVGLRRLRGQALALLLAGNVLAQIVAHISPHWQLTLRRNQRQPVSGSGVRAGLPGRPEDAAMGRGGGPERA